jgi:cardiolipin synthase (CMP-forming)
MPSEESPPMRPSGSSERNAWLTIPNAITLLRLLAIIPFVYLATRGRDLDALVWFVIAGLTDALDGTLARWLGQVSKIGRLLDPIVDKLFTGVSYIVLSAFRPGLSHVPMWVMVTVLLRDAFILTGSFLVYSASHNAAFKPSIYGKLNTFLEISVVVCFLAASQISYVAGILPALYVVLLISIVVSAGDYLRTGMQMIRPPAADGRRQ